MPHPSHQWIWNLKAENSAYLNTRCFVTLYRKKGKSTRSWLRMERWCTSWVAKSSTRLRAPGVQNGSSCWAQREFYTSALYVQPHHLETMNLASNKINNHIIAEEQGHISALELPSWWSHICCGQTGCREGNSKGAWINTSLPASYCLLIQHRTHLSDSVQHLSRLSGHIVVTTGPRRQTSGSSWTIWRRGTWILQMSRWRSKSSAILLYISSLSRKKSLLLWLFLTR